MLSLVAPYNVSAGGVFKVGSIIAVATSATLQNATVEGIVLGVFDVAKVSAETWSVGEVAHWDDNAKVCANTNTGTVIGVVTAVAANPSSTGRVRLNGKFG